MDALTKELLDHTIGEHRDLSHAYLAGLDGADLYPMGRGQGTILTDSYGDAHLDFGVAGRVLVTGHRDPRVLQMMNAQANHSLFLGAYGSYLEHYVSLYAKDLSQRCGPDKAGQPRRVLFVASSYEARMTAAQISISPDTGTGGYFLALLDNNGAPREGGEVQDEVHRARAHGLKIIAEESVTGFGRSGTFSYYEQYGVTPDIIVLGPQVGAGLPMCAVVAPAVMFSGPAYAALDGVVDPSANPLVCAMGKVVLDQIDDEMLQHVSNVGRIFGEELRSVCEQFAHVITAVAGVGLMWSITLTHSSRSADFRQHCRNAGLIISPDLRLTPPLNTSEQQVRVAVDAIAAACIEMGNAG